MVKPRVTNIARLAGGDVTSRQGVRRVQLLNTLVKTASEEVSDLSQALDRATSIMSTLIDDSRVTSKIDV